MELVRPAAMAAPIWDLDELVSIILRRVPPAALFKVPTGVQEME